jgi:predicted DNA-binding transcriptional regulator AlpA
MPAPGHPDPVLSVKDAQAYLGNISRATLYRLCAEGGAGALPVVYLTVDGPRGRRGRRGFRQSDLDAWVAARTRRA